MNPISSKRKKIIACTQANLLVKFEYKDAPSGCVVIGGEIKALRTDK